MPPPGNTHPSGIMGLERAVASPYDRPMEPSAGLSSEEVKWTPDGRFVVGGTDFSLCFIRRIPAHPVFSLRRLNRRQDPRLGRRSSARAASCPLPTARSLLHSPPHQEHRRTRRRTEPSGRLQPKNGHVCFGGKRFGEFEASRDEGDWLTKFHRRLSGFRN